MVRAQLQKEQETEEEAAHQTLHDVHGLRIEWNEGEAKVWSAGEMIMHIDYEGQEITDVRLSLIHIWRGAVCALRNN